MNKPNNQTSSVLAQLRSLCPNRGLGLAEALGIAERQATALLRSAVVEDAPVPLSLLSNLPRICLKVEAGLPSSGLSFWDGDNWQLVAKAGNTPTVSGSRWPMSTSMLWTTRPATCSTAPRPCGRESLTTSPPVC